MKQFFKQLKYRIQETKRTLVIFSLLVGIIMACLLSFTIFRLNYTASEPITFSMTVLEEKNENSKNHGFNLNEIVIDDLKRIPLSELTKEGSFFLTKNEDSISSMEIGASLHKVFEDAESVTIKFEKNNNYGIAIIKMNELEQRIDMYQESKTKYTWTYHNETNFSFFNNILFFLLVTTYCFGFTLLLLRYRILRSLIEEKLPGPSIPLLSALILLPVCYQIIGVITGGIVSGFTVGVIIFVFLSLVLLGGKYQYYTKNKNKRIFYIVFGLGMLIVLGDYIKTYYIHDENAITRFYILSFVSVYVVLFGLLKKDGQMRNKWVGIIMRYVLLISTSFVCFYILEGCSGQNLFSIDMKYWFYNIIWYILLVGGVYLLTNRVRITIIISLILCTIYGVVNGYIIISRGYPIIPVDIYLIRTAVEVAESYPYSITQTMYVALMVLAISMAIAINIKEKKANIKERLSTGLVFVIFALTSVTAFIHQDDSIRKTMDLCTQLISYRMYGTSYCFGLNVMAMQIEKPEGYDTDAINDEMKQYIIKPEEVTKKPNIIVIMDEAFSDLAVLGEFETNIDYLPYFKSLKENTIKGTAYPSVLGSRTANSEYEFLTGNTTAFLPVGAVPYQQYVREKQHALPNMLKELGYQTTVIHPFIRNTYLREVVYPLMGFDTYLAREDFVNPTYARHLISDQSSFEKIIEVFEKKEKGEPAFIFNVTMQNHGGYTTNMIDKWVRINSNHNYAAVEEYLSLVYETDKALKILIDYFSAHQEEPTYIVFFGDHQPFFSNSFVEDMLGKPESELTLPELQKRYQVPFFIWSNTGDIKEQTIDGISLNYLSSLLVQTAGLPLSDYQNYLLQLYEKYPVINANGYIDKNGKHFTVDELKANPDILLYQQLVYNAVVDGTKGLDSFLYSLNQ